MIKRNKAKFDKKTGYQIEYIPRTKVSIEMSWNEFCERFAENGEEFSFWYNKKIIDLYNLPDKSVANFGTYDNMKQQVFANQKQLLENARFDGKTLKEIWDELE